MPLRPQPWLPYERLALGGLLLLATLLRLYGLGEQPVWCDETYFWLMAQHDGWAATVLQTIVQDVYPPLHFLLLHALGLFTTDLFWVRLPMALAGVAGVGVLWSLLRRHFSPRAALMGGALAAVSPLLIYHGQEMKMYSLLGLLLLLLLDECLRCLQDPRRPWGRLALWAALAVYTFYLSLIIWACFFAAALWVKRRQLRDLRPFVLGFGVAGLAFLPWAPFFLKSVIMNGGSVMNLLMERIVLYSFQNFSLGFWAQPWLAWASLPLFGGLIAWGLAARGQGDGWAQRYLLLACLGPLLLSWTASMLLKPTYSDRAMLVCAYAWLGLAGIGLARLPKALGAVLAALALALPLHQLWRYHHDPLTKRADLRPAWSQVLAQWQPGDAIFHEDITSHYPFKFFTLQEARDPTSPYYGGIDRSFDPHRPSDKPLRPNWLDLPGEDYFPTGKSQQGLRRIWRRINAWLATQGFYVYAGSNRDHVHGERIQSEALPGVRRIWFVSTPVEVRRRLNLPQINVWRAGFDNSVPLDFESRPWLVSRFKLQSQQKAGEIDLRLFTLKEP